MSEHAVSFLELNVESDPIRQSSSSIIKTLCVPQSKIGSSGLRSVESSNMSLDNTDPGSSTEELEPNLIQKVYAWLITIWQSQIIRKLRLFTSSYGMDLFINVLSFLSLIAFILVSTYLLPGRELPTHYVYNGIHIGTILLGHVLWVAAYKLVDSIHRGIVAAKVTHSGGISLRELSVSSTSAPVPGYTIRQGIIVLTSAVAILMSFLSINFEWIPITSSFLNGSCIPATYGSTPGYYHNLGDFLQGDVDLALIYTYGIPLEDGLVGGWSSWPLVNPATESGLGFTEFSVSGSGYGYALLVVCGDSYTSNQTFESTTLWLESSRVLGNAINGKLKVYLPANSSSSSFDKGQGVYQQCMFNAKFGKMTLEHSFVSDEWEMVVIGNIKSLQVGNSSIEQRKSKNRYYAEFAPQLKDDEFHLINRYDEILGRIYNGTSYHPSQGATFSNVLSWGTLPDGLYHDDIVWKGVAAALATPIHYLLMQYDGTATGHCEYFGYTGAGFFIATGPFLAIIQVMLYILIALCILHVWWMFLVYEMDESTSMAFRSISSPIRFAQEMHAEGEEIFGDYGSTMETLNEDIVDEIGNTRIYYGVHTNTIDDKKQLLTYGTRRRVTLVKKIKLKLAQEERQRLLAKRRNTKSQMNSKDTVTTLSNRQKNEKTSKVIDISVNDEKQEMTGEREGGLFPDSAIIKKSFPGTP